MFVPLGDRLVKNDDVFAWDALPRSVVVFGAGIIGLELGQALSRLGVRVRVFGRGGSIRPLTDPAVMEAAKRALEEELAVDFDAEIRGVRREGDEVVVGFDEAGITREERFEYALIAAGRRPNLAGLGLGDAGLPLEPNGSLSFDRATLQVGATSVFVAGDANDDVPLLHEAADEGRIAGENAATYPVVRAGLRRSRLAVVFSDPQIAVAGESFASLSGRGDLITGEVSFTDQGRSRVMRKNKGLLRVYADPASGRLLGAEMVGPRAEHLAHLLAWSHQEGLTIDRMLAMPFYHPVVEEGLRTALRDAASKRGAPKNQSLVTKTQEEEECLEMRTMEGKRVPEITFRTRVDGQWKDVTTADVFAKKKVVVFALPGAFTPTCSSAHVPRYEELAGDLKAKGVDEIVCVSVNDAFVMDEWGRAQHAGSIRFLPDGNGELTEAMGMLVDKSALGFGKRSWRYSMLVDDGVIQKMFVEPDVPGDPFQVSDADTMLRYLDPQAKPPHDVLLFTKPGCSYCSKAKMLLRERGWAYEEVAASPRNLRAVSGKSSTPQVFVDGAYVGGADELEAFLAKQGAKPAS
jgi:peroxiredoxin/glutaredoxin